MPPVDESPSFEPPSSGPKAAEARRAKPGSGAPEQPSRPDLVSLTIDAATGRIVKVEGADAQGARRELSEDDRARLAKADAGATLQGLVEQAFEAGIACALGEREDDDEPPEADGDAELSRLLLQSLIERSAAKRLLQREILGRAIVGTLIEQAAGFGAPETAATH